jgi:hypothetical protein
MVENGRPQWIMLASGAVLAVCVGVMDYFLGYQSNFSIFYLLPLMVLTWYIGIRSAVLLAVINGVVSLFADILASPGHSQSLYPYWNSFERSVVALIMIFLVHRVRQLHIGQKKLIGELNQALAEINRLGGLIPICAWCKKVREDGGYWKQVEDYIRDHSEADFTHSICPECEKSVRAQTQL